MQNWWRLASQRICVCIYCRHLCIFLFTTRGQRLHSYTVETLDIQHSSLSQWGHRRNQRSSSTICCFSVTHWMTAGDVFLSPLDHFCLKCMNVAMSWLYHSGSGGDGIGGVWCQERTWVVNFFPPFLILLIFLHLSLKGSDTVQGGQGSVGLIWRAVGRGLGMIFQWSVITLIPILLLLVILFMWLFWANNVFFHAFLSLDRLYWRFQQKANKCF